MGLSLAATDTNPIWVVGGRSDRVIDTSCSDAAVRTTDEESAPPSALTATPVGEPAASIPGEKFLEADLKLAFEELERFEVGGEIRNDLPSREQTPFAQESSIVPWHLLNPINSDKVLTLLAVLDIVEQVGAS